MRALPRPASEKHPLNRTGGNEKISSRGVDVPRKAGMMSGSLGHFGDGVRDQALRPVPTIFDSVRR